MRVGVNPVIPRDVKATYRDMYIPGPGQVQAAFGLAPTYYWAPGEVRSGNIRNRMAVGGAPAMVPQAGLTQADNYGKTLPNTGIQGIRGLGANNNGWNTAADNTKAPGTGSFAIVACFSLGTAPATDTQCSFGMVDSSSGAKYIMFRLTTGGSLQFLTRDGINTKTCQWTPIDFGYGARSVMLVGGYDGVNFWSAVSSVNRGAPGSSDCVRSIIKGTWVGISATGNWRAQMTNYAASGMGDDYTVAMCSYLYGSALDSVFTSTWAKNLIGKLGWR